MEVEIAFEKDWLCLIWFPGFYLGESKQASSTTLMWPSWHDQRRKAQRSGGGCGSHARKHSATRNTELPPTSVGVLGESLCLTL